MSKRTRRWIDRQQTPNTEEDEMNNRLEEICERAEKATAGPWNQYGEFGYGVRTTEDGTIADVYDGYRGLHNVSKERDLQTRSNSSFIAHAREDIPYLLSLLETTRSSLARATTATEIEDMKTKFYAELARTRDNALEEAAKVAGFWQPTRCTYDQCSCDAPDECKAQSQNDAQRYIAQAIRAMKGQRP